MKRGGDGAERKGGYLRRKGVEDERTKGQRGRHRTITTLFDIIRDSPSGQSH